MFKRIIIQLLGVALVLSAASSSADDSDKTFTIKFSHQNSSTSTILQEPFETFMQNVESKSDGRIKFKYFPAQMLVNAKAGLSAVMRGVADIQVVVTAYNPSATPVTNLYMLPGAHSSSMDAYKSLKKNRKQFIQPEADKLGTVVIGAWAGTPYDLYSSVRVEDVADLSGMKVRSPGAVISKVLLDIDAVPVQMSAAEMYGALQKSSVDALAHMPGYLGNTVHIYEAIDKGYIIDVGGLGTFVDLVLMNKKTWNKLPKDLQKLIMTEGWKMAAAVSKNYDTEDEKGLQAMVEHGDEAIEWTPEAKAELAERVKDVRKDVIQELDDKGLPASKLIVQFEAGN